MSVPPNSQFFDVNAAWQRVQAREAQIAWLKDQYALLSAQLQASNAATEHLLDVLADAEVENLLRDVFSEPEPEEHPSATTTFESSLVAYLSSVDEIVHNVQTIAQMGDWQNTLKFCMGALQFVLSQHQFGIVSHNTIQALMHLDEIPVAFNAAKTVLNCTLKPHHRKMILGLRAEMQLKQGNLKNASQDISEAIQGLEESPLLDYLRRIESSINTEIRKSEESPLNALADTASRV